MRLVLIVRLRGNGASRPPFPLFKGLGMRTAKPKREKPKAPHADKHCGECVNLQWNTKFCNLDVNGLPIHGDCKRGGGVHIRTDAACAMFEPQPDDELNFYQKTR